MLSLTNTRVLRGRVADRLQAEGAEVFIDRFIPRVFLLESYPCKRPDGRPECAPIAEDVAIADNDLLKQVLIEFISKDGRITRSGIL